MAGSLRSVREEDWPAVLELSRRALARPEEQVGNPLWETREELESEIAGWDRDPAETLRVEEEEGTVAGFGGVEVASGWDHADLFGPLVRPAFRGRKIGSRLLDASIECARRLGATRVIGSVGTRNSAGKLLLERDGFRALGGANAVFRFSREDHRPLSDAPDDVVVRPGVPDDLDSTLALYRECFPEGRFPDAVWRQGLERGTVYLAEHGGRPVAVVDLDPSDRWLYHLGVTEKERAHGVGAYLLSRALEDYWSAHPDETLGLTVRADNIPAIRLYRRQGFAPWLVLQTFELSLNTL